MTVTVTAAPAMSLDAPAQVGSVGSSFYAAGWAIDRAAASGTGVDAVHVWAYPNPGSDQSPVFLGVASYGGARTDVGAVVRRAIHELGFFLTDRESSPGTYRIAAFAHSTVTGTFNDVRLGGRDSRRSSHGDRRAGLRRHASPGRSWWPGGRSIAVPRAVRASMRSTSGRFRWTGGPPIFAGKRRLRGAASGPRARSSGANSPIPAIPPWWRSPTARPRRL